MPVPARPFIDPPNTGHAGPRSASPPPQQSRGPPSERPIEAQSAPFAAGSTRPHRTRPSRDGQGGIRAPAQVDRVRHIQQREARCAPTRCCGATRWSPPPRSTQTSDGDPVAPARGQDQLTGESHYHQHGEYKRCPPRLSSEHRRGTRAVDACAADGVTSRRAGLLDMARAESPPTVVARCSPPVGRADFGVILRA
jgi:hypothetical protein